MQHRVDNMQFFPTICTAVDLALLYCDIFCTIFLVTPVKTPLLRVNTVNLFYQWSAFYGLLDNLPTNQVSEVALVNSRTSQLSDSEFF